MVSGYWQALGATIEVEAGAPIVRLPFGDHLVGRPGFLHGGAIAGLLEYAALAALREALGQDRDTRLTTVTVTIDYMRGGRSVETRAAGRVLRLGRRIANVEAYAWQEDRARPIAAARINVALARAAAGS
ncbi:MAG: phenylacetic acid degradation protein [Sphingomonas bacterium]|nr:phenylacetic acid degradation protein [Sphingomonas bacterium]MDB5717060.1 phenylacetic acid degradation protein [Sphingomonas bacterium]